MVDFWNTNHLVGWQGSTKNSCLDGIWQYTGCIKAHMCRLERDLLLLKGKYQSFGERALIRRWARVRARLFSRLLSASARKYRICARTRSITKYFQLISTFSIIFKNFRDNLQNYIFFMQEINMQIFISLNICGNF